MSVGAVEDTDTGESTESTESTETETVEEGSPETEQTPVDNPSRPTRAERRAARAAGHNAVQEAAELRRQIAEERERRSSLEASVAEMRGYMQSAREREQKPADDTDAKIAKLEDEADRHLLAASQSRHPEIAKEEMRQYKIKLRQAAVLDTRRELSGEFEKLRGSMPNQQVTQVQTQLYSEFPWTTDMKTTLNRAALKLAGELEQEMLQAGRPGGIATSRAALAEAAKHFGIGGRPSQAATSAFNGVPSREGASGTNGAGPKQMYSPDRMGKDEKRLAEQAFPKLEPALAWNAWSRKMNAHFSKQQG